MDSSTRTPPAVICAVLAGGQSRRMGADKAFLELGGRPLIQWTLGALAGIGQELIIIANDLQRYAGLGARVEPDIIPGYGALGGIYTALARAGGARVLVVACDMPFLSRPLLRYLIGLSSQFDAVVPRLPDGVEPLHAVYSRACLEPIRRALARGDRRIISFFDDICVRYVEPEEIAVFDPQFRSFMNINTSQDLQAIRELLQPPAEPWPAGGVSHERSHLQQGQDGY
ncbi:MAG: molybdenum cofactor guanylyltransferase [Anaerolineae bacterium]|nr:molybdenum cofactor guanylyltransferase [Anaerolineae bacterium]